MGTHRRSRRHPERRADRDRPGPSHRRTARLPRRFRPRRPQRQLTDGRCRPGAISATSRRRCGRSRDPVGVPRPGRADGWSLVGRTRRRRSPQRSAGRRGSRSLGLKTQRHEDVRGSMAMDGLRRRKLPSLSSSNGRHGQRRLHELNADVAMFFARTSHRPKVAASRCQRPNNRGTPLVVERTPQWNRGNWRAVPGRGLHSGTTPICAAQSIVNNHGDRPVRHPLGSFSRGAADHANDRRHSRFGVRPGCLAVGEHDDGVWPRLSLERSVYADACVGAAPAANAGQSGGAGVVSGDPQQLAFDVARTLRDTGSDTGDLTPRGRRSEPEPQPASVFRSALWAPTMRQASAGAGRTTTRWSGRRQAQLRWRMPPASGTRPAPGQGSASLGRDVPRRTLLLPHRLGLGAAGVIPEAGTRSQRRRRTRRVCSALTS